ncbi:MAG: NPCBM/NEW2 domain-containing protein [Clostridia bacterium]|nr:NPCBM/NEW2 domain-containing protein [Clostridia bacterium]
MKKIFKNSLISFLSVLFVFSMLFGVLNNTIPENVTANGETVTAEEEVIATPVVFEKGDGKSIYLSSLEYITENNWSYNGWAGHTIQIDKNQEGGQLSLIVNGEKRTFYKGISVHAKGQVTYDISEFSADYPRFTAKIGVDASRGTNGSIKYIISVSDDGQAWKQLLATDVLTGASNAVDVDVSVEGKRYLRIYVDPNGSNAADHGTVANAKLVMSDYVNSDVFYESLKQLSYYDDILRAKDPEYNYERNYREILEREFVNKLGYWNIQSLVEFNREIKETLDWILGIGEDVDESIKNRIIEEVIEVGEITRPTVFLEVLSNLYHAYGADLQTENGYVYEKMMIGLAAAYSTDNIYSPLVYGHYSPDYDYLVRYGLVKRLFEENKFAHTDWFKEFHVEFMRSIMQDALRADETMWFSNYVRVIKKGATGPYSYMGYVKGNFILPAYFDEANREFYDKKFHLSEFDVPYGDNPTARYWMVFQHGGICWNLARTGQSVQRILGLPSTGLFQPSHEAFLLYTQDADGKGFWYIGNNNHGWGKSSTTWYGGKRYRLLFNWGAKSFVNHASTASAGGTNSGYQYLAQANLNRYDDFKKSIYLNLVANSYTDNQMKVTAYNKALESMELNLDSYDYLIKAYKEIYANVNESNRDAISAEWKKLAERIIDVYTFYPQAMYDLLQVIKPNLNGADLIDIELKEKTALERASKATKADIWQDLAARELANAHLGKVQANIASFSFDGENAGKIVIDPAYDDYDIGWHYRLDGGDTSPTDPESQILAHSYQLSPEEIAQITADNDIKIFIDGMPQNKPAYTIDIQEGVLPDYLYANDLENRVIGVDLTFEWRNNESEEWTSYAKASPNNTGDKTLFVRAGATKNRLPSESRMFTFTADNQPLTRRYVSVSHLSIEDYSTQSVDSKRPFYAPNAIDGNANTLWHTDFRENVLNLGKKPFITIKLDKPRYISAVEFKQLKYKPDDPDSIKAAKVYVSEDKENWTEAGKIENCPLNSQDLQIIDFSKCVYGQYVKLEFDTYNMFASLSMVNIFQDLTVDQRPTAGVAYSTTKPTNQDVVARLLNVSSDEFMILSEGGDTHVFHENGEFTFRFRDTSSGKEGSAVAVVDWIDKVPPTATIEYNTTLPTKYHVIATLKPDKDVVVTNNGEYELADDGTVMDKDGNVLEGYTVDEEGNIFDANKNFVENINRLTYEFFSNGEFTFEFVDAAGNTGTAKAEVDWINPNAPDSFVTLNIKELTNQDVVATIAFRQEDVTVTNNNGSLTYTFRENGTFAFEFVDGSGNRGSELVTVTWIDKTPPTARAEIDKSNKQVAVVRLVDFSEEVVFAEGDGTYRYTKNGTYTIEFYDKAGNMGSVEVVIDWLATNGKTAAIVIGCLFAVAAVSVAGTATFVIVTKRKKY